MCRASKRCWKFATKSSPRDTPPPRRFRPLTTSTPRLKNWWRTNCAGAEGLDQPSLVGIGIGRDIGRRLDGIGAEQLSCADEQSSHFVELLLRRRISHGPTLPRPSQQHNSPFAKSARKKPVGLIGGDLRSENGPPAHPESYPGITG